ncbi:carboxy-cis,cis-muconate cyclase [Malassezia obtusa]|uniref:Carboxy-cis,cis-muconate cyclase n=1 Tax=Malassezia obtusa TaxID=76774 RepID=A0AAF0E1P8_9BASI|nr:carboxy-cis,cis-muconate cyclase [Malassezia obtusa]
MTAPPLAASVWGTPGTLPSLEPTSLYASTLLQLAFGSTHDLYSLEPRAWPHPDTVPSLYAAEAHEGQVLVGEPLATTPDAIRDYLREHSPLDAPLRAAPLAAARAQATQAILDDALADLVLHTLFSLPPNFQKVTASALAGPRARVLPSSLPRRLRAAVRARLESPAIGLWGLGGSWERQEKEEARRWNTTAGLAEARDPAAQLPKAGLHRHPSLASDVQEQWERSRIAARARELFATLRAMLGAGPFLVGCTQPTSVDARMYSLLAPLLLGPPLPIHLLSTLLRDEFPELVEHTQRLHEHLWGAAAKDGWAWRRADALYAEPSLSLKPLWNALDPRTWFAREAEPAHLPPTLRYGRLAFYLWAVFGSLAYIALTGLITIEYEDPEEAPEDAPADGDEESVEEPIVDEADPNDMGTLDPSEYLDEGLDDDDDEE